MNPIYRVVFNAVTGVWQAVSETARGRSKSSRSTSRAWSRRMAGTAATRLDNPPSPVRPLAWAARMAATGIWASLMVSGSAFAVCNTAGTTVTCATGSNTNSLASSISSVTLDVQTGAVLSVPPIVGGSAVNLSGNGITVNNQGTVDPTINGGLSLATSGMVLGNNTVDGNTINVNNQAGGAIKGLVNIGSIHGFGGQALVVQNASGGVSNIFNAGNVDMSIFGPGLLTKADAASIVSYGGAQTNLDNTGTITGRIGFQGSTTVGVGNTLLNAGTINGSVNLGSSASGNTFTAVSGSSVNTAGIGVAGPFGSLAVNLAAAGIVDGGSASNNNLVLQNSTSGPGAGTGGAVTTVDWSRYINFQKLTIHSGTWNLQGAWAGAGTTTLNDGLVNFNNAGAFGTGTITVNGGAIAASTPSLNLANSFVLSSGKTLTLAGTNAFGLGGEISGDGGLTVNNTGIVTLGGANLFSGGVSLNAGGLVLGNAGALGGGTLTVGGSASLDTAATYSLANNLVVNGGGSLNLLGSNTLSLNGSISGAGNVTKNGAGTLTLNGAGSLTGNFNLAGGALTLGAGGSLSPTGAITVGVGTTLNLSAAADQTIGSLAGLGGSVNLGSKTLTFAGLGDTSYSGTFAAGMGGLVKLGTGVQTLSGVNNLSGGVALNAGGLVLGNAAALGSGALSVGGNVTLDTTTGMSLTRAVNLGLGARLNLLGSQALTLGGVIGGSGSLVKNGATTLTLNGANTFSGGLALNAGDLVLGNAGALGTGALTVGGETTLDASAALSVGNGISLGAGGLLNVLGSNALTLGGAIGGSGSLVKKGAATLTLGGANTFTGGLKINAGKVAMGSGASLAAGGAVSLAGVGAELDISAGGDQTIGALSGIAGSTVTLGDNTLTFGDATNQTFAGVISGTGGLVKQGMGIQTLSGTNAFTEGVNLKAGGLLLGNKNAIGSGKLTVSGNSSLDGSAALNLGNTIKLDAALTLPGSQNLTLGGDITGTGSLTKNGASLLTLNGSNTFSGGLNLNAGNLLLGNSGALGSGTLNVAGSASLDGSAALDLDNNVSLGSGAVLSLPGSQAITLGGVVSGAGSLVKNGASTLTLNGANAFTGGLVLNGGGLMLGNADALGTGLLAVGASATLDSSVALNLGNDIDLDTGAQLSLVSNQNVALGGLISGTGGLVKTGSGVLSLNNSNSFSGGLALNAGSVSVGANGALGTGALNIGGNVSLDAGAAVSLANAVNLGANTLTLPGSNNLTLSGVVGGAGGLIKSGASTLTLSGANTYTGGTTINAGTLALGTVGSLAASGDVTLGTDAGFDISGASGSQSIGALNGVGGSTLTLGGNSLTFGTASNAAFDGVISGGGSLVKVGAGVQTLSGANTFGGGVTLNAGGLVLGNDVALGTGALTVGGAATLDTTGPTTLANNIALNAGLTVLGSNALTLNGVLSGAGSLTKNGGATLTLNGTNTYTGGTIISAGTLALGAGASLAASGIVSLASGATFDLSAGSGTQQFGTLVGNGTVNMGANMLTIGDASNGTFSGSIGGTGGLTKVGSGIETLTGTNTYTGGTFIDAGTLAIGAGGSLAATGAVWLASGTTLDIIYGGNQAIGSLAGVAGSTVALGGNTLTLGGNGNGLFAGSLTGTGGLVKNGAGIQTLSGFNDFGGGVALNAGGLVVGHNDALGTGALTVGGNTTLDASTGVALSNDIALASGAHLGLLGSNALTLDGVISGAGGLIKDGTATVTLSGANTYVGGTTINNGTLTIGAGGSLAATGAVDLAGTGTLDVSAGNQSIGSLAGVAGSTVALGGSALTLGGTMDSIFNGAITGNGSLVKNGAGVQTLNGANTFSGGVTLNAGGLVVGNGSALGTDAVTVAGNATLDSNTAVTLANRLDLNAGLSVLGSNNLTLNGSLSGAGSLNKDGVATLTLAGANTYSGGTTINAGTLVAANASALGTGNVTVGNGAALEVTSGTTLDVLGDLNFQSGSIYRVQADSAMQTSSKIKVTGTATLAGGVLHVGPQRNAATDFQVGQTYTILQANQITGQFNQATSDYGYLNVTLGYLQASGTTTDVTLTLGRKPSGGGNGSGQMAFAELADTGNQAAVANGIESLPTSHTLYNHVLHLPNGAPAALFSQVSGDTHASVAGSLNNMSALTPGITTTHLRANLTAGMYPGAPVAQSDGPLPASAWPSSKALPAWAEVVGHWQTFDGNGNAAQLKQRTTGIFLGMDQEVGTSGWRLGGSVGYTNADGKVADRASESDVNSYSAAVYGGKSFGTGTGPRINVLGGLAYTWHDIETTRRVTSLGQTLKADYNAHTAQLFAEVGYAIGQYDAVGVEPFLGVNVGTQRTRGFQERGGFAALQGRSSSDDLASTTLGVRVHSDFQLAGKEGRLRATVGWRHALGDVAQSKTMAFEGGQNFTVAGSPLARNTALLGLEADVALSRSAALVLGYQGELGSGQRDHSANVKLRWAF